MKQWILLLSLGLFQHTALAASAQEAAGDSSGLYALAAALSIALAAVGGALGLGRIGAAAMEGLARNPQAQGKMLIPMIISLAFIESVMIFALVIAILILGNLQS